MNKSYSIVICIPRKTLVSYWKPATLYIYIYIGAIFSLVVIIEIIFWKHLNLPSEIKEIYVTSYNVKPKRTYMYDVNHISCQSTIQIHIV